MIHSKVFFNTEIQNQGCLAAIGNFGLTPVRYLFNGQKVATPTAGEYQCGYKSKVHHVASFHMNGAENRSKTSPILTSSSRNWLKAAGATILLIPGLMLSIAKLFSYLFQDIRQEHQHVVNHFSPQNQTIGSLEKPIQDLDELSGQVYSLKEDVIDIDQQPTNALIIHGNGNLQINTCLDILEINPKKLILNNANIVHDTSRTIRLDDAMKESGWLANEARTYPTEGCWTEDEVSSIEKTFVKQHRVQSIEEALNDVPPIRTWSLFGPIRYKKVYIVETQKAAPPLSPIRKLENPKKESIAI